jgi:hypothetical protein
MRNLFIITSAINSRRSAIDVETRFIDTFKTIESVRQKDPKAIVVMFESSPDKLSQEKCDMLKDKVDVFFMLSDIPEVNLLGSSFKQSSAESLSMKLTLGHIKSLNIPLKRVFKLTGRGYLTDDFDISYYDDESLKGKYVFRTRIVSWMDPNVRLLSTRCWSFDYSLIDEAIALMQATTIGCFNTNKDLEHVIFEHIDKSKLAEKDVVGFDCRISLNGNLERD